MKTQNKIDLHNAYLNNMNFFYSDFTKTNFFISTFEDIDLSDANFENSILTGSVFKKCTLKNTNFHGANLINVSFIDCDLTGANLSNAMLSFARFINTDLNDVNLCSANLSGANLTHALNVSSVKTDETTSSFRQHCPEYGPYIGYKKVNNFIIKLLIPEDALRSSATTYKCRASKAIVAKITCLDGTPTSIREIASDYDPNFIYTLNKAVEVPNFDRNRWAECAPGIHHFLTRKEAEEY